jgi:hypothetical protein
MSFVLVPFLFSPSSLSGLLNDLGGRILGPDPGYIASSVLGFSSSRISS